MNRRCTGHEAAVGMPRRELLSRFGMGLGSLALADLLSPPQAQAAAAGSVAENKRPD